MLTVLGIVVLILGLTPAVLYLLGRIPDPFHPLIIFGAASYAVSAHKLLLNPAPALYFMPSSRFEYYLLITIASMVAFYAGWFKAGNRPFSRRMGAGESYDCSKLLAFSVLSIVVGCVSAVIAYEDYETSGYLRDLKFLWISGSVVGLQVIVYSQSRTQRLIAMGALCMAAMIPLNRFIVYGQRSDVLRSVVVVMVYFLAANVRPKKAIVVTFGVLLVLTLATLSRTRESVNADPSLGARLEALSEAIPKYFEKETEYLSGQEFIFGPAAVGAVRDTGQYGYGRGYTVYFLQRFAPRYFFPDKWSWFSSHAGYNSEALSVVLGGSERVPSGAACTGFAQAFCELWWLAPLLWFGMGVFFRRLWDHAVLARSPMAQGLYAVSIFVLMIGIFQQLAALMVQAFFTLFPLFMIYSIARVKNAPEEQVYGENVSNYTRYESAS